MRCDNRRGTSAVELLLVLVIVGLLTAAAAPSLRASLASVRLGRAADAVAGELGSAGALASRLQRPVLIACECGNGVLLLRDRATGVELRRLDLAAVEADGVRLSLATANGGASAAVFPSGNTSTELTATLTAEGERRRRVTLGLAGLVRLQ